MEQLRDLSTGAKIVLGAAVAFLIVSFFSWFDYDGPGSELADELGADTSWSMWHGIGWIAGLLAIALVVWQALRVANIELEIGVTASMVTAALALLLVIFTFIRFVDTPSALDRTVWAWLGLALAIVVAVGAWLNMQAAGESLASVRDRLGSGSAEESAPAAAPASPPPSTPAPPDAAEPEPPESEPRSTA
jgi:hypothetical protein